MSDTLLRSKLIRLAHSNPTLRPHLLPLLKDAAGRGGVNPGSFAVLPTRTHISPAKPDKNEYAADYPPNTVYGVVQMVDFMGNPKNMFAIPGPNLLKMGQLHWFHHDQTRVTLGQGKLIGTFGAEITGVVPPRSIPLYVFK